ncbi:MAG: L-rhamnose mutarotase [Dehalococcoidia bacterium]
MKSFAQALDLKNDPETIELYKKYHREVWPEVLEALQGRGIERMEIFLLGNHLFMYCIVPDDFDPRRDFEAYTQSSSPRPKEWNDLMSTFQQKVAEAGPDDWWTPMERVFDTEWFKGK